MTTSAVSATSAETVFGFRCRDPFSGVAEGSQAGHLCLQFQKCATCPGALIPLDNVEVVGRLLSAFAALGNARERAIKEGWMLRFKAHYETTWQVLAEEILPAVSEDIKQRAMQLVDERRIPSLE